ncbi:Galactinol synthase 2 [Acorus calamus]|uniref:Galactinol synthase 2 n=1 Tax=Acorus calamus TaxID=4465 RepID=A0AAV9CU96_ACOCL|nr:Galactinol synthase 2 [Acorus calamus]
MDCSFCGKTWSHTRQYQIGYCQQCRRGGRGRTRRGHVPHCTSKQKDAFDLVKVHVLWVTPKHRQHQIVNQRDSDSHVEQLGSNTNMPALKYSEGRVPASSGHVPLSGHC